MVGVAGIDKPSCPYGKETKRPAPVAVIPLPLVVADAPGSVDEKVYVLTPFVIVHVQDNIFVDCIVPVVPSVVMVPDMVHPFWRSG